MVIGRLCLFFIEHLYHERLIYSNMLSLCLLLDWSSDGQRDDILMFVAWSSDGHRDNVHIYVYLLGLRTVIEMT